MRTVNNENINEKDVQFFSGYKEKGFFGHKKQPNILAWNQEGNFMMTAENVIKIWAFNEKLGLEVSSEAKGHDSTVSQAGFINDHTLLTLSRETLKIWDIRANGAKASRT